MVFPRAGVKIIQFGRRPVIADPNNVLFYNRRQEYRREPICERGDRCEWFSFSDAAIISALSPFEPDIESKLDEPFRIHCGLSDDQTYMMQRRVYRHAKTYGSNADRMWIEETMLGILRECVAQTYHRQALVQKKVSEQTDMEHRNIVLRTRQVIAGEFRKRLTLNHLAERVACSPFHLSRIFRRITGQSIHRYLTKIRLRTALEELDKSSTGLTSLALNLGFSSHSHFTFAFRQHFGTTPTAWKQAQSAPRQVAIAS